MKWGQIDPPPIRKNYSQKIPALFRAITTTAAKNIYLALGFTKTKLLHICALKKTKSVETSQHLHIKGILQPIFCIDINTHIDRELKIMQNLF